MTHSSDNQFIDTENAAHGGAFGANSIPEPTEAQRKSGNYKMGRVNFQGLAIAIEQPRGAYRTGIDSKTGKRWTSRMAAHYGYISKTKGNDGDGVDCFLGPFLESMTAYVINQFVDGRFDEHKVMLGFANGESARSSYLGSYERGWNGMESIIPVSLSQLKWWLKNGDMGQPLREKNLPYEGLEAMTKRVQWNSDALPYDQTLDQVLYEIRQSDSGENLLLDSVSINDIIEDSDGVLALDALVTPFVKLERKMELLRGVMERAGKTVKVASMQISDPFSQRGVANVAVIFELSDGQTVSIYFHNPDVTPKKMAPSDEIISWKWLLNKKDITIVVAPERGQDLNVREVARRIMRLAEKNSAAFARANARRSERMQNIQSLKDEIVTLEAELKSAQNELEIAKVAAEGRTPAVEPTSTENGDSSENPTLPQTDFHVDIASLIEALPGLDGFGISSLTIRTNGEISAVSNNNIKNSGVTDADILAAYGKGLLREASGSFEVEPTPAVSDENGELEYNPDSGDPVVIVNAEYKYIENGWSSSSVSMAFTAPGAPDKFAKMDGYIKNLATISGIASLGEVFYSKEEYGYRGVSKKGIRHEGVVLLKGDDGKAYVRLTLSINNSPTGGVVTKAHEGSVRSFGQFIQGLYQSAVSAKHDKPMPEAMKIIARISGHDQDIPASERNPADATEENGDKLYKIYKSGSSTADSAYKTLAQVKDALDEIDVRGGEYFGIDPENGDVIYSFKANTAILSAKGTLSDKFLFKQAIDDAIRWANSEIGEYGTDWMKRNLSSYLALRKELSKEWSEKAVAQWFDGTPVDSEEITAAKAFLKSVVEGTSNASDLMKLLDEIEASAQALIDAGLGAENDELIGGAAERWAELDQQENG